MCVACIFARDRRVDRRMDGSVTEWMLMEELLFWLALIAAVRSAAPMAWCRFRPFKSFQAVSSYVKR